MQKYNSYQTSIPRDHPKAGKWISQCERIYDVLLKEPHTRLQVSCLANVPIQNVCRRIADLKKSGVLCVVRRAIDPLSGMIAEYLSVDPKNCKPCSSSQLEMFE